MTMTANGYAKLLEELGELAQVAAKRLAYFTTDEHPDGAGSLSERIEDEMGDVIAACNFVAEANNLNRSRIHTRAGRKLVQFHEWHGLDNNNAQGLQIPGAAK